MREGITQVEPDTPIVGMVRERGRITRLPVTNRALRKGDPHALYSARMKTFAIAALLMIATAAQGNAQTAATARVMRQKLIDAQGVMAAVVTSNWGELDRRSKA